MNKLTTEKEKSGVSNMLSDTCIIFCGNICKILSEMDNFTYPNTAGSQGFPQFPLFLLESVTENYVRKLLYVT